MEHLTVQRHGREKGRQPTRNRMYNMYNIKEEGVEIRATNEFNEYFDSSYLKKDIQP